MEIKKKIMHFKHENELLFINNTKSNSNYFYPFSMCGDNIIEYIGKLSKVFYFS